MCGTCGCGEDDHITYRKPGQAPHIHTHEHLHSHGLSLHSHPHSHDHDHDHAHDHSHDHSHAHHHSATSSKTLEVQKNILSANDLQAERNKGFFEALSIMALNLVSSPGSGKTSILERTIKEFGKNNSCYVIEGDQQTMNDAQRIKAAGAPVVQINTGNGCHLDALMVNKAVKQLSVPAKSILFIENVGNLVCPALFDLGENKRVVIISVTEGEDKPAKYPNMFETSHLCLINKSDLLPYLDFNLDTFKSIALKVNPRLQFIVMSAKSGEGFTEWYDYLHQLSEQASQRM